jgi:hypothetical protein
LLLLQQQQILGLHKTAAAQAARSTAGRLPALQKQQQLLLHQQVRGSLQCLDFQCIFKQNV